jgi:hypothetical protein
VISKLNGFGFLLLHILRENVAFLQLGQWHIADEYDGQVRELNCKSICHSPMCPPYSAMTEWQHIVLSADKMDLVCFYHTTECVIMVDNSSWYFA